MLCYRFPSKGPCLQCQEFPSKGPHLHHVVRPDHKVCHMYDIKNDARPHSTEQDTQLIALLISKQAISYQTRGGTCCPGVSTPKIRSLADSSITCYDGINHLCHSNHCSNHSIDPHTVTSRLDGWKTTTLSQRHKPNSTSQRYLYDSQDCMAKHN
jgi:hypothetical protein